MVQKYGRKVPKLARPIDYALIDYVTRDSVAGGINRNRTTAMSVCWYGKCFLMRIESSAGAAVLE